MWLMGNVWCSQCEGEACLDAVWDDGSALDPYIQRLCCEKTNPPMPKKTMVINDVPREPSWVSGCHAIFIFIQKSYDTAWWFLVAWCQLIPSIIGNLHDTISRWVLSNCNVIAIRIWACHYQIMEGLSFPRTLFYSIVIMWYVCCMTRF